MANACAVQSGALLLVMAAVAGCVEAPTLDGHSDPMERLEVLAGPTTLSAGCEGEAVRVAYAVPAHPMVERYELAILGGQQVLERVALGAEGQGEWVAEPEVLARCGRVCGVELVAVDGEGWRSPALRSAEVEVDADADGFVAMTCGGEDCDDGDATVHPEAAEVCDGVDNNCSGLVDEADPSLDSESASTWFADGDGDGYGDPDQVQLACDAPGEGWVDNGEDCDDGDATVHPGAAEVCDGVDNNCSGLKDDADPALDLDSATAWYVDADGDGFGDPDTGTLACLAPEDGAVWVSTAGDCDDTDPQVNPAAPEVCNGIDDNCSGLTDDDDPDVDPDTFSEWFLDADGDGFGDPAIAVTACAPPEDEASWVDNDDDCDDTDPAVNPDAEEVCDGIDNDCSGEEDDMPPLLADKQLGVCEGALKECTGAGGWVEPDYLAWHSAYEPVEVTCDNLDNDCDGVVDTVFAEDPDSGTLWCWGTHHRRRPDLVDAGPWRTVEVDFQAGGYNGGHACAIDLDDGLHCWGSNARGELGDGTFDSRLTIEAVSGGGAWRSAALGGRASCGIQLDGSLWCWGRRYGPDGHVDNPAPEQVGSATSWEEVTLGGAHGCGIQDDGSLWCWGWNNNGQLGTGAGDDTLDPVLVDPGPWQAVAAGGSFTCALDAGEDLWCWGLNAWGQTAVDPEVADVVEVPTLVQPPPGESWTAIGAGAVHACALDSTGAAWCWGRHHYGQLGDGTAIDIFAYSFEPRLASAGPFADITVGQVHSCAMEADGTLWCWGRNEGLIGDGTGADRNTPQPVEDVWKMASAGDLFTCALAEADDSLWCWGDPDGYGTQAGQERPSWRADVAVRALAASTGGSYYADHVCLVTRPDGELQCFGGNGQGQLGIGTTIEEMYPVTVMPGPFRDVAAGERFTCAVDEAGARWCWGENGSSRKLGDGGTASRDVPWQDPAGTWAAVTAGTAHGCGIQTDQSLWCWGSGAGGRLGLGTTSTQASPQQVGTEDWHQVSAGGQHTCGLKQEEGDAYTLWCWGTNNYGQLGLDDTTNRDVPVQLTASGAWRSVSAGKQHTCAVRSDDTLWCWGRGLYGRLGIGSSPSTQTVPAQVGGEDWLEVTAGDEHTCGLKVDGTVWCWGDNFWYQLAVDYRGGTYDSAVPVPVDGSGWSVPSAGSMRTCATRTEWAALDCAGLDE